MFVVTVAATEVDLVSDVLWGLGVRAIEERSAPDGRVELWTAVGDEPAAVERAASALAGRWPSRRVEVDTAASETWRDFAVPMWVDDTLVVVPAWQEHVFAPDVTVVAIEPAGAFGLGDHPTTALSLGAVRRAIRPGADVLDVGCGTGVLSIAAALLGARSVRAVDLASAAVEATIDNAHRNGVAPRIAVDTARLAELEGGFDLVVANILAPTLVELADELRRVTAPGGVLVVSGVLADRHDHVLAALHPMVVVRTDVRDGWAAVTLRHDGGASALDATGG